MFLCTCSEVTSLLLQSRLKYEEFVKKKSLQDQEFYRYVSSINNYMSINMCSL